VRATLAAILVGLLIVMQFAHPHHAPDAVVASARTLAIAVVAFYFGLHRAAERRASAARNPPDDVTAPTQGS
jgi:hypothetical protein